jgi:hypothetical protein
MDTPAIWFLLLVVLLAAASHQQIKGKQPQSKKIARILWVLAAVAFGVGVCAYVLLAQQNG